MSLINLWFRISGFIELNSSKSVAAVECERCGLGPSVVVEELGVGTGEA